MTTASAFRIGVDDASGDIGFSPAEARRRALLANSLYIGWFHQRLILQRKATPRERRDYQRAAVKLLTAR